MPVLESISCGCSGTYKNQFREAITHFATDKHIQWAYHNKLEENAKKTYQASINQKIEQINELIKQVKTIEKEKEEMKTIYKTIDITPYTIKLGELQKELTIKIDDNNSKDKYIEEMNQKNTILEIMNNEKSKEIEILTNKNKELQNIIDKEKEVKEISTQTSLEEMDNRIFNDVRSDTSSTISYSNYINDFRDVNIHKKHQMLFEILFGYKPLKYVKKGENFYTEFCLIRSSYQYNYKNWEVLERHKTTYDPNERITFGIPTISLNKDGEDNIYYNKYHLYVRGKQIISLTGWNGVEYSILQYS